MLSHAHYNKALEPFLNSFVIGYLDDVFIYLKNHTEHMAHVKAVLQKFQEFGLYCKGSKCEFSVSHINFLGFIISESGVEMEMDKIQSIKEWPTPESVREVQVLLGFMNFYRQFIKHYAKVMAPISNLLHGTSKFE